MIPSWKELHEIVRRFPRLVYDLAKFEMAKKTGPRMTREDHHVTRLEWDGAGEGEGEAWAFIRCERCDRRQTIVPADESGGITVEEAKSLGWEESETGWLCPFHLDGVARTINEIIQKELAR